MYERADRAYLHFVRVSGGDVIYFVILKSTRFIQVFY